MRTLFICVCCFVINKICGQNILESNFHKFKACGDTYIFPVSSSVSELNSKIGKSVSVMMCASMCLETSQCDGINFCKNSTNTFCQSLDFQNPMSCGEIEEKDHCNFFVKADSMNKINEIQTSTEESTFPTTSSTDVSYDHSGEFSTFSTTSSTEVSFDHSGGFSTFPTTSSTEVSYDHSGEFSTFPTTSSTEVPYDPSYTWLGDCSSIHGGNLATSNVYTIQPSGAATSFSVLCDVKQDGVYTRIMDHGGACGVDDWNLPMSDYISGFGSDVSCDHWIGLRNMLYLTHSGGNYKLEINIKLQNGNTDSVYYEYFYVKDQSEWTLRIDVFNKSTDDFLANGFNNSPISSDADLIDNEDFEASGVNIYGCSGGDKSGWWFDEFCTNPNLCLPLGPVEEALYPLARKLEWPDRLGNKHLVERVNMQIRRT